VADPNVCQYWSPLEPKVCKYWNGICTYVSEADGSRAEYYPYCNLIGTKSICDQYDAGLGEGESTTEARCILPDVHRHVVDRLSQDGSKWVTIPAVDGDGNYVSLTDADYSRITKYNKDHCKFGSGDGTSVECSAFSPYHLGFSTIQPDDKDATLGYDQEGYTTGSGLTYRLPLSYEVFNLRAILSKCYWWDESYEEFTIYPDTGQVKPIEFKCTHPDSGYVNTFSEFRKDDINRRYVPPCNGCKPECQYYTGVCWQYCIDEKMRQGDKVLAEQILELRYYLRKNRWNAHKFAKAFKDPQIYAWAGTLKYAYDVNSPLSIVNWNIDAYKTEITDFEDFEVSAQGERLTTGTKEKDGKEDYPTLVRALNRGPFTPLIRNKFYKDSSNMKTFEASSLSHDSVLLVGDVFFQSPTYAINLSDPDLSFLANQFRTFFYKQTGSDNPDDLIRAVNDGTAEFEAEEHYYESMSEVKAAFKVQEEFDDFYDRFDKAITRLITYWPEKVSTNELSEDFVDFNMFYIDVPTFWGENIIMVLNQGSGRWEFDLLHLNKLFCGGVIAQTSFELRGEGDATIDYLPNYEQDFFAHTNNNGLITFEFKPFDNKEGKSAVASYVYNDYACEVLPANPLQIEETTSYHLGYTLYKVELELTTIENEYIRFMGNAGYAIVEIPDENIHNVHKDWEVENLKLVVTTGYTEEGNPITETIDMEIFEKCTDRLETNQMIVRPKNISEFKTPCEVELTFDSLYYYEKRSFGEEPELVGEPVREDFLGEDDNVVYVDSASIKKVGDHYELTEFGRYTLLISVVYKGAVTNRIKGVMRTKMLTWVRQPFCRDVEIQYSWTADYRHARLLPEYVCYGKTSFKFDNELITRTYTPLCGDHNLHPLTGTGPMWYPYNSCEEVAPYPVDQLLGRVTSLTNMPMEVFTDEESDHGAHDMRMLGPQGKFGEICGNHASVWNCTCDWSYCNYYKAGEENRFTGWGRYRCGLDAEAKTECTKNGGDLPKFGNPFRDFLRSFRSIDNVFYYRLQGTEYSRRQKWLPLYYFYNNADITAELAGYYPCELYTKDLNSPFVHPMGLYLADGQIEGVNISESIEDDRYDFDDVFKVNYTKTPIKYPYPTNLQFEGASLLIPYYTYKDLPGVGDKSIQWAWQEIWKSIERENPDISLIFEDYDLYDQYSDVGSNSASGDSLEVDEESFKVEEVIITLPYTLDTLYKDTKYKDTKMPFNLKGPFSFCEIEHPPYEYDAFLKEHRLVLEEDNYMIFLIAPPRNDDGSYSDPKFYLQIAHPSALSPGTKEFPLNPVPPPIGIGDARAFGTSGDWDDVGGDVYGICTNSPWTNEVDLFHVAVDTEEEKAEEEDRVIVIYDDIGDKVKTYYQRGLKVSIDENSLKYLPKVKELMNTSRYEVEFSKTPTYISETNKYASIEPGEPYPVEHCFEFGYYAEDEELDFIFHFDNANYKAAVERIVIMYKFGSEVIEVDKDENPTKRRFFHRPALELAHSDAGLIYDDVYSINGMQISTITDVGVLDDDSKVDEKPFVVEYNATAAEILDPHDKWRVRLRVKPRANELEEHQINPSDEQVVFIKCIYVYDSSYRTAREDIETHERKYRISSGFHGDFPPHGYESGLLLRPVAPTIPEYSTVYQRDTVGGIVGQGGLDDDHKTMNKIRGRLMFECHEDEEPLPVNTLEKMEQEQEEIYNDIAIKNGATSFSLKAVIPPGFNYKLEEAGAHYPELWRCQFLNTMILPLTPVEAAKPYSPEGFYFDWDFSNFHWEARCAGSQFGVFSVGSRQVFEYKLYSAFDPDLTFTPEWAIVVYYNSIGKLLVSPWDYLKNIVETREGFAERELANLSYPPPVEAF
jgi:hypothetical protein